MNARAQQTIMLAIMVILVMAVLHSTARATSSIPVHSGPGEPTPGPETQLPALAQVEGSAATTPAMVSYQGYISVSGTPYDGTGYFKFAISNSGFSTVYWANATMSGGQPNAAVGLAVSKGVFSVNLGDSSLANMAALAPSVFVGAGRYLRVWFSTTNGGTYTQLPNVAIASVPYALNAETLDGADSSAFAPSSHTHWGAVWSGTGQGLSLTGTTIGVTGVTTDTQSCNRAYGVKGIQGGGTNPFCDSAAVMGEGGNMGVFGTGTNFGIAGVSQAAAGDGVFARADGSNGMGVTAYANGVNGTGVYGLATSNSVTAANYGVQGTAYSGYTMTAGVRGYASSSTNLTSGVYGRSDSSGGAGVLAHNYWNGPGLRAYSYAGNLIEGWAGDPPGGTRRFYVDYNGNLFTTGSKAGFVVDIVRNADSVALQPGDLVAVVGSSAPVMGEIPVMEVRRATSAAPSAIVGVVDQLYVHDGNPYVTSAACLERVEKLQQSAAQTTSTPPSQAGQDHVSALTIPSMPAALQDCTVAEGLVAATGVQPGQYLSVVTLGAYKTIKVDASFGAVQPGDLLAASPNPGYAMKAVDPKPGTVVGKALSAWQAGVGVIPVLLTLQ